MRQPSAFLMRLLLALLVIMRWQDESFAHEYRLASFSADVTIPLGHRCMGVLPTKSTRIADPLQAHGFVLQGVDPPLVVCAVDWCEIRNGAYDLWRDVLAHAAATTRERVLVCSLHQHDAPVVDQDAANLLSAHHLEGELYDQSFHQRVLQQVEAALRASLAHAQIVSQIGFGQARVEYVASNRRVVMADGRVTYGRSSRSADDAWMHAAEEGTIDPWLKTVSFWNDNQPVLALHVYATHPMSSYGAGAVSADFVGQARARRQRDDPQVQQIYASGCSGDVTAGKYNDGSAISRDALADRLYQAMVAAWSETRRVPLAQIEFRNTPLCLEFSRDSQLAEAALMTTLADNTQSVESRILAAMGLASRQRVARGQAIDVPCIDFGAVQVVLFPGETFVEYQLRAQQMRPDSFVVSLGYGECWPGYIPTENAFQERFHDQWLWVAPGSEQRLIDAVRQSLVTPRQ